MSGQNVKENTEDDPASGVEGGNLATHPGSDFEVSFRLSAISSSVVATYK